MRAARAKMAEAGVADDAVAVFAHYYAQVEQGELGLIREADIEPVEDLDTLDSLQFDIDRHRDIADVTAVIKLNGGLGTSMGMDRAKSLLPVKDGLTFLDIIVRQILTARARLRRPAAADLHEQLPHTRRRRRTPWPATRRSRSTAFPSTSCRTASRSCSPTTSTPVDWPDDPRPRVVPARARRPLSGAAGQRSAHDAARTAATGTRSARTPTTSVRRSTRASRAGWPSRRARRSCSSPRAERRPTARAATWPGDEATAG